MNGRFKDEKKGVWLSGFHSRARACRDDARQASLGGYHVRFWSPPLLPESWPGTKISKNINHKPLPEKLVCVLYCEETSLKFPGVKKSKYYLYNGLLIRSPVFLNVLFKQILIFRGASHCQRCLSSACAWLLILSQNKLRPAGQCLGDRPDIFILQVINQLLYTDSVSSKKKKK